MRLLLFFVIGLVFGLGISISGMANPAKVLNFFDVLGVWDPSLAFVMAGALMVTAVGYRFVLRRPAPVLSDSFNIPTNRRIDVPLLAGALCFGVGWGIAGFCPGGAIPALGTANPNVFLFMSALVAGIFSAKVLQTNSSGNGFGLLKSRK